MELSRYLGDLKGKNDEARLNAAKEIRKLAENTIRSRPTESVAFVDELNRLILDLVNSTNIIDKLGGITVIGLFTISMMPSHRYHLKNRQYCRCAIRRE